MKFFILRRRGSFHPGRRIPMFTAVAVSLLVLSSGTAFGQAPVPTDNRQETALDLQGSMAEALQTASAQRDQLKSDLDQARRSDRALASELAAYRVQLSTYGNLAALPGVDPEVLAKALAEQRKSLKVVREALDQITARRAELAQQRSQTGQQLALNEAQQSEIKKIGAREAGGAKWLEQLAAVIRVQKEKLDLIERLDALYADQAGPLQSMEKDLTVLGQNLAGAVEQARRTAVLTRGESPLSKLDRAGLDGEANRLRLFAARLREPEYWQSELQVMTQQSLGQIVTFWLLTGGLLLILMRLRTACRRRVQATDATRFPWRGVLLAMVQRAAVPLGLLAFFSAYSAVRMGPAAGSLIDGLIAFCWVWLPGNWLRAFFDLAPPPADSGLWRALDRAARRLVRLSRAYAGVHLFLVSTLGAESVLAAVARLAFEVSLVVWLGFFWRRYRRAAGGAIPIGSPRAWGLLAAAAVSYTVVLVAPLFDLVGYGRLAFYWLIGWGWTLVAGFWSALVLKTLWEAEHRPAAADVPAATTVPGTRAPLNWALLRLAWLSWGLVFGAFLVLVWGGWQSLASGLGRVLSYPLNLGGATLRLSGMLVGLLILFFTHLAVRLWRHLLHSRVLARSGISTGAQDSIKTISSYLFWALGILMALHAFGVSTTSLTVAFGALGIGLGFGLQNIFNNFISGLILLFERPIQVGDDIEISGIWAKVTRINVRSTVVQTYDNASLIIPNSDLISSQVTNWSHKDPYVRRNINVGVAYGSDTQLVRRTLLEVAAGAANVRRYPEPDVLFTDFGDSALIFRLRLWTDIDNMLKVDTAVRFEIDRLFRQRGIEIAFPQQDIHIRNIQDTLPIITQAPRDAAPDAREPADDDPG